jgi:hypothetical protein
MALQPYQPIGSRRIISHRRFAEAIGSASGRLRLRRNCSSDYFGPEFVKERYCSARSKEVSPILLVHSRVLTPPRWSL